VIVARCLDSENGLNMRLVDVLLGLKGRNCGTSRMMTIWYTDDILRLKLFRGCLQNNWKWPYYGKENRRRS